MFAVTSVGWMRVPLLPDIGRDVELTARDLGLATTVFAVGRLATDLPAGWASDRLRAHVPLAVAAATAALASAVLATAGSFAAVAAALGLLGVATALANTTGMIVFGTRASAGARGRAMAAFTTAIMLGQMAGPAAAGALAGLGSWRTAQLAGAAAAATAALGCAWLGARRADGERATAGEPASADRAAAPLGCAARLALASVSFVVFFALAALPQTLIPIIGAGELGLSTAAVGAAAAAAALARLAGALLTGAVSDRVSRMSALIPSMLAMAASVALLALPIAVATWLAALVLLSLASSGMSVATTILVDRSPPGAVGRRFGAFRLSGDLGLLAGPACGALVYERSGRAAAALLVSALLLASTLACAALVRAD